MIDQNAGTGLKILSCHVAEAELEGQAKEVASTAEPDASWSSSLTMMLSLWRPLRTPRDGQVALKTAKLSWSAAVLEGLNDDVADVMVGHGDRMDVKGARVEEEVSQNSEANQREVFLSAMRKCKRRKLVNSGNLSN
ncbi:hypothetical protein LTR16_011843, partial [Cryomyces antarcticus]